jgi:hypothetical protein
VSPRASELISECAEYEKAKTHRKESRRKADPISIKNVRKEP